MKEHDNKKKPPCLAFLIPFAPRQAKSNWKVACEHLRQTLRSVQNSACGDFCVVVAGHDAPDFDVALDSRFCFLSMTEPPPVHPDPRVAPRLDKLMKITAAWNLAKARWMPRYVMKLDADDFISSKLVGWLESSGDEAGYIIPDGWIWQTGTRFFIQRTETFDRICGSCSIIRSDIADLTGPFLTAWEGVVLDEAGSQFAARDHYSLVPGSGTSSLIANDNHGRIAAQFAYLGEKCSKVPFPAAIYRVGNADSIVRKIDETTASVTLRQRLGSLRRTQLITSRLKKEFALYFG